MGILEDRARPLADFPNGADVERIAGECPGLPQHSFIGLRNRQDPGVQRADRLLDLGELDREGRQLVDAIEAIARQVDARGAGAGRQHPVHRRNVLSTVRAAAEHVADEADRRPAVELMHFRELRGGIVEDVVHDLDA